MCYRLTIPWSAHRSTIDMVKWDEENWETEKEIEKGGRVNVKRERTITSRNNGNIEKNATHVPRHSRLKHKTLSTRDREREREKKIPIKKLA